MGTKSEELAKMAVGEGCLGRADHHEPIFILRAHDVHAVDTVRFWAWQRMNAVVHGIKPVEDIEWIKEALELAARMDEWRQRPVAIPDHEAPICSMCGDTSGNVCDRPGCENIPF